MKLSEKNLPMIDTQTFDIKIRLCKITMVWPSGIYGLSFDGTFLYIGMSYRNLSNRINRFASTDVHPLLLNEISRIGKSRIDLHIKIVDGLERHNLLKLEKEYIDRFRPRFNILGRLQWQ